MKKTDSYTIGFDLGGTKLAAAFVRSDGHILDFVKIPVDMKREKSAIQTQKRIVNTMTDIALEFKKKFPAYCSQKKFLGVGVASAGPLNAETGVLINPINYPGWKKVEIKKMVERSINSSGFKTKVFFQNDAIAAAFAEGWVGKAQGLKSYAVVTVGTGIGTGVIVNGFPCQTKGAGSEFGHSLIDFNNLGKNTDNLSSLTVEGIASGTALIKRARHLGFQGQSIEELVENMKPEYSILFEDMAKALAVLCYNLSIGFHLDAIFFSGGLIKIKNLYLAQTKSFYKKLIKEFNPLFICPLEISKSKNKAGVLGAAYLPYRNS